MTENLRRVDKPAVLAEVARQAVPLLERASHLRRAPDAQDDFGIETQLVEDLMPQWQQAGGARVLETEWRSRGQFLLEKADDLAPDLADGRIQPPARWQRQIVQRGQIAAPEQRQDAVMPIDDLGPLPLAFRVARLRDRKSTRLNSSHGYISYAVFCLKKKKKQHKKKKLQKKKHKPKKK